LTNNARFAIIVAYKAKRNIMQACVNALIALSPILLMGLAIIAYNIFVPGKSREDRIEEQCSRIEAKWAARAQKNG